ncbi:MAG: hypothetical protein A2901_07835 [Elusimicrobia bacterium RIFCSPLOWO2_01_FULL_54_10]|nr:MAG: hypothetical protein A2901_07835 [Elusimicrobia bacterium RIFCSPLOWO2_01_FULL_54_10]
MKISVIIATLNRAADLRKALESILSQTEPPFEVLVIDQSVDEETCLLAEELKESALSKKIYLRYIRQSEKSLVKARNRGILLAAGEIISFLDDDIVLFSDYFAHINQAFEADSKLAGVSGNVIVRSKLEGTKWRLRKALMEFFLLSNFDGKMTVSGFGTPIYERVIDRTLQVEFLPGCDMNFRKDRMGDETFDEWFTGYSFREDAEFSYRMSQLGKCIMIPQAKLYHNYSVSNRLNVDALTRMTIQNYHYVYLKHKNRHFYSKFFFGYSILGLVLMDLIEFLSRRDPERFSKVRAEVATSIELMMGGVK